MTDSKEMDLVRVERVLGEVDLFKPIANRRRFMQMFALAGAGAAAAATGLGVLKATPALAAFTGSGSPADWVNAAVGAERIAVAFYSNALGTTASTGVAGDAATTSLLNASHRKYFVAALGQESSHLAVLQSVGGTFPYNTFGFPAGTFGSRGPMLAMGAALENIFIGAYLSAIASAAAATNTLVAEAAAQILGIECEHRVLINDLSGVTPPNDRFYEGPVAPPAVPPAFGDSGARSTLYSTSNDAVGALLALNIVPHA